MNIARLRSCLGFLIDDDVAKLLENALLALCFLQPLSTAAGQEPAPSEKARIVSATRSTCVIASGKARTTVKLLDVAEARPTVTWTVATEQGRLLGRYSKVSVNDRFGGDVLVNLEFPLPPLKPGVVLPLTLQLSAVLDGQTHRQTISLHAFSEEAFAGREETLKHLRIQLFDPEGDTAERFDEHNIPYTRLIDLAAIDLVQSETLIVGEGVSVRDYRSLGESLTSCAQRGAQVLCLAPREDDFPLVLQSLGPNKMLPKITFDRSSVVHAYDKRFDAEAWGDKSSTIAGFVPTSLESDLSLTVSQGGRGWPWVNLAYRRPGLESNEKSQSIEKSGRLILCGFGILSRWEESPVPRHLLARLFDEFATSGTRKEKHENVPPQP